MSALFYTFIGHQRLSAPEFNWRIKPFAVKEILLVSIVEK